MTKQDRIELTLNISATDASAEDIDRWTRQLLRELNETNVDSAQLAPGGHAPKGTKSADIAAIGSIVVSVAPTVLSVVIDMARAWASRGRERTVVFKGQVNGQTIEFEGHAQDLEKILATLGLKGEE